MPSTHANTSDLSQPIALLTCVRAGKAVPFTRGELSAINKMPVSAPVSVNNLGLVTDEQADYKHHGGVLKAVHEMPTATYARINEQFDLNVEIGSLGENLTTMPIGDMPALDERNVCIGDVYQYGDASADAVRLRVVQPRRPCYKINDKIGNYTKVPNIAAWISKQGISGWYYEVVQKGEITADIPVYLIERPYPFATLAALWQLTNSKEKHAPEVIEPWLAIECLEESWKKGLKKKIKKSDQDIAPQS